MKSFVFFALGAASTLFLQNPVLQTSNPRPDQHQRVGPLSDGGFLLSSGWTIRPAGQQVPVDTFPMSTAVSNNGKYLLVLNGGYNPPSVSVINIAEKREITRTALPDAWLGLAVAPSGDRVYVGGGSRAAIYELTLDPETGSLAKSREFGSASQATAPTVAFIGDVAVSPDAHLLYAADLYSDSIAVINLQSGQVTDHWKTGRRPYRILVAPGGKELIVSSWADGSVYLHNAGSGQLIGKVRVGPHPTDLVWVNRPPPSEGGQTDSIARLFVAAANTNTVYSFGVTRDGQLNLLESINVSLTPLHPLGMTPSALATDRSGAHLFVACSDANAVAEVDISTEHSRVMGFIPTGWYPTAVRSLDTAELVILNGKGLGSRANPDGPVPTKPNHPLYQGGPVTSPGYVAHIQTGTAAFLTPMSDAQLDTFTQTVMQNSPYRDEMIYSPPTDAQDIFFSRTENHPSPIQHVIYIIKENRTYDQVLGDLEKGNGDKSLTLFGEDVTPNFHRLARDFILYDNFYENADVSADGHNWASAAIAPDYTVKTWPSEYAHRKPNYDYEGDEPANTPPAGYIWDNALQAGVTIRDYGQWTKNVPLKSVTGGVQIQSVNDPALRPYVDIKFRGFDLEYTDVDRAKEFVREWKDFEAKSQAPQLLIVRMGNDHTAGTRPGALTPLSYAADNDFAVGILVDQVSHSSLWPSTAIFIIEDDAQNGPDHVDSHRAPAWVISPFTRRGIVDSNMYNQTSVLRTMEMIVGLRPMTHFDAAARPMFGTFAQQPDTKPFDVLRPKTSLTDRNTGHAPGAAESARMNFSEADLADDDELNTVVWRAIKHSDPPPPTVSRFGR